MKFRCIDAVATDDEDLANLFLFWGQRFQPSSQFGSSGGLTPLLDGIFQIKRDAVRLALHCLGIQFGTRSRYKQFTTHGAVLLYLLFDQYGGHDRCQGAVKLHAGKTRRAFQGYRLERAEATAVRAPNALIAVAIERSLWADQRLSPLHGASRYPIP